MKLFTLSLLGKSFATAAVILLGTAALAQPQPLNRPKLVVGIVVDQMRYDFLYRYWAKYSDRGFKRLLKDGYSFENAQYNYVPTVTAVGHSCVYTGATPRTSGIAGNDWFDRARGRNTYCTDDSTVTAVGGSPDAGKMSPRNLLVTTITDELRFATNYAGRTFGIALKDRGAILPAGHSANAAYWWDRTTGQWMTSNYYTQTLPGWVQGFNKLGLPDSFLNRGWQTLLPIASYTESTPDDEPWERAIGSKATATLPYVLKKGKGYDDLAPTPWGNTLTRRFAEALLNGEHLGTGATTDFLTVSFSSTDYAGHAFGPNSVEVEDIYLRLDGEIATLLDGLEKKFGKNQVMVFLTADHAVDPVPEFLGSKGVPAGRFDAAAFQKGLEGYLENKFGAAKWIIGSANDQIYFNGPEALAHRLSIAEISAAAAEWALSYPHIAQAVPYSTLAGTPPMQSPFAAGWNAQRSGDLFLALEPGWLVGGGDNKGTSHGASYAYDTHVPLLFYGWGIKPGSSIRHVTITDVAPTIAALLHTSEPNGNSGTPLLELFGAISKK